MLLRSCAGQTPIFSGKELALLRTFADQAVIAIENARLFNEVQAKTRDLTEIAGPADGDVSRCLASSAAHAGRSRARFREPCSANADEACAALTDRRTESTYDGAHFHRIAHLWPAIPSYDEFRRKRPRDCGSATAPARLLRRRTVRRNRQLCSKVRCIIAAREITPTTHWSISVARAACSPCRCSKDERVMGNRPNRQAGERGLLARSRSRYSRRSPTRP